MALIESIILLSILIFLIYKWSTAKFHILKERAVPHGKPLPLIGNLSMGLFLGKTSIIKYMFELHKKYKNEKVYGNYNMRDPFIFVNDVELIKKICIKDFDNFTNHGAVFPDDGSVLSKSLIVLKGRKWKEMRNTLTPTFTGSKMRLMYELINECAIEGVKYIEAEAKSTGKQELELEMKDFFTRFANDVIASAAFGFKVNSFQDKENDFYNIGNKITQFSGWAIVKSLFYGFMPKLLKLLRVKLIDSQSMDYFNRLVLSAIKNRELNHIVRPDMINLLMEAKKHSATSKTEETVEQAELTDEDILAQCLLFFFAGFDTVSVCLCFTLHELMENPAVQQKLFEEIIETEEKLNGQSLSYDVLMKMKYMDMVLSESLRKWPPAMATDRICSKDYNLLDEDNNLIVALKKDDVVWIPVLGQHWDPENFENPMKFDPERFSDENKTNIKPFTYIPFGIGPRNCIGNRLALMETKSIIYHIILRFEVTRTPKTAKDILESMDTFKMIPKEKFWMKFVPRKN